MDLSQITPVILTYNEEPNIERTLAALAWAKEILVVDSFSDDATLEIVKRHSHVRVLQRAFDSFGSQWNFALQHVNTPWVWTLDADYLVTPELEKEISELQVRDQSGFEIPFRYCVFGKPLRATILPPRCMLFLKDRAAHGDDGHRQTLKLDGSVERLRSPVHHDDRKPLERWVKNQHDYALLEVQKLCSTPREELGLADRIRLMQVVAPPLVVVYCLFVKGGLLDGWRGTYYALQRGFAELILSLHLIEHKNQDKS